MGITDAIFVFLTDNKTNIQINPGGDYNIRQ